MVDGSLNFPLLFRGLLLGFSIAAPVGPIGVLCIRRTLANGWIAGLSAGLGAATADAIYGSLAAFGLSAVSEALVRWGELRRLGGGLFLGYLGVRTLLSRPTGGAAEVTRQGLWGVYFSTFTLTLTNPMTILSFGAVFAALGLATGGGRPLDAVSLVTGVFLGSAAWWVGLSGAVSRLRSRLSPRAMIWINRISGVVIIAFALLAISGFLQ